MEKAVNPALNPPCGQAGNWLQAVNTYGVMLSCLSKFPKDMSFLYGKIKMVLPKAKIKRMGYAKILF
jgi:hypothetical protein